LVGSSGEILTGLTWQARLLEVKTLLSEPGQFLNGHQVTLAAILYSHAMGGRHHPVGIGSSLRLHLRELVAEYVNAIQAL
jgi:hypothetical protein